VTSGPPFSEEQIEALVRTALEAEGRDVDVPRLVAAIEARLATGRDASTLEKPPARRFAAWSTRRRFLRWSAAAACLLVAGAAGVYFSLEPKPASAYSLVESVHSALLQPADRCYRVEMMKVPAAWSVLIDGEQTHVWTRGDRFRVSTSKQGQEVVWGQDEEQRTWVVYDEQHGLRFEKHEIPPPLAATLSYLSLDLRLLTGQILEDFDLQLERGTRRGDLVTVRATARGNQKSRNFHSAELEIEPETKTIRHMVLTQFVNGTERGRFAFTLIGEEPLSDESYHLEAQLDADAKILTHKQRRERSRKLFELLRGGDRK